MAKKEFGFTRQNTGLSRLFPIFFLVLGEAMLTVNQTNVSSVYLPISNEFNTGVYGLGILTSALFLSYGLFEVPGGILAISSGPKRIAVIGFTLNTLAVIGSSFSSQFSILVLLRFVSGIGSAFAFPTILVLIVKQLKEGSEGLGSGWTVGWSSLGAALGLIVWPILAELLGWRISILFAGLLDLIPLLAILALVKDTKIAMQPQILTRIKKVVTDKRLALVGLALFGAGYGFSIVSNFVVYYLEQLLGTSPDLAGLIAALSSIVPVFAGPLIGRSHDRVKRVRLYFLLAAVVMALGVGIIAIMNLYVVIASGIALGFALGIYFTLGFALAKSYSQNEYESLGVAWVDSFSLIGGIVSPILFSLVVLDYGYPLAWIFGGIGSFLPVLPLLIFLKE
ncbi:MAG TPA: MFS transporter [Nitrososphaerales archaeon]|nr:MFS transporter [Nitrososphaerales archaeon]